MITLSQDFWIKALVFFSALTFVFGGVHIADDIVNNAVHFSLSVQTFALVGGVVLTLRVFATLWSWAGKQYGYITLGLVSLVNFYGLYLSHALEAGVRGYAGIGAGTPEGWLPLYVTSSLYAGVVTATQIIIVIYLLIKARRSSEP